MAETSVDARTRTIPPHALRAAWLAGLAAAVAELVPVLLIQGLLLHVPAARVLQAIASGLLGSAAYAGGLATALLGGLLHLIISLGAAVVFVVAALRWSLLIKRPVLAGLGFGILVWFVMSYLIVPLSAAAFPPASDAKMIAMSVVIHMLAFGLPIALVARTQLLKADAPQFHR